jgi:Uma2 family endonuclease
MSTATSPSSPTPATQAAETLSTLLERLGGVSPSRVRLHPPPGLATAEDLIRLGESAKGCELVDGVLVEKAMGYWEDKIGLYIGAMLLAFVAPRKLGSVTGGQGFLRLGERLVRAPDAAFTSADRLAGQQAEPFPRAAFNLAVEVLSRGNTPGEMLRKRRDYFQAGVELVWVVDPPAESISVYTPAGGVEAPVAVLRAGDTLEAGEVLPGFTLPVSDVLAAGRL